MKKKLVFKKAIPQRIDKFLKEEVFLNLDITRGEIIRNIKQGNVLVNGKKIKASYLLRNKNKIEIDFPFEDTPKELKPNQNIPLEIIFENDDFIIINKPSGLQVHPSFRERENTLANALIAKYPELKNVHDEGEEASMRPGIVHRLDKDTSGIMVVAKNEESFFALKSIFQDRKIKKKYIALVYGVPEPREGIIEKPLARSKIFGKQVVAGQKTKSKIREAVTIYKTIKEYKNYALVEALPKTGRMHQIRVHLSFLGNPVVGDLKYRRKNTPRKVEVMRHLLHAKALEFELKGQKYAFETELPDDFSYFLAKLD